MSAAIFVRKDFKGFVMLNRGEEVDDLMRHPNAFTLLSLIALRARYANSVRLDGLKIGQALIGDWEAVNLTRGQYRAALKRLVAHGYITTLGVRSLKEGKRGTIATITNDSIYSITGQMQPSNDHHPTVTEYSNTTIDATTQTTIERPSNDHRTTTNNKGIKEKRKEGERGTPSSITFSESDYQAIASDLKITEGEAQSRTAGKLAIKDIRGSSSRSSAKVIPPEPAGWRDEFPDFVDRDKPWHQLETFHQTYLINNMPAAGSLVI